MQVYDVIASHFSSTRFAVWPKVRAFLERLPSGSVVADVGCGNGKYLSVRTDLAVLGSDRSAGAHIKSLTLCASVWGCVGCYGIRSADSVSTVPQVSARHLWGLFL